MVGVYFLAALCRFTKVVVSFRVDLNNMTRKTWTPITSNQRRTLHPFLLAPKIDFSATTMSVYINKIRIMSIEDPTNVQVFPENIILV